MYISLQIIITVAEVTNKDSLVNTTHYTGNPYIQLLDVLRQISACDCSRNVILINNWRLVDAYIICINSCTLSLIPSWIGGV